MANLILDDVTINQPVADNTARDAIVETNLIEGALVMVNSDTNTLPTLNRCPADGADFEPYFDNIDVATAKATPVLADEILIADSAETPAFLQKKSTLTALQTTLVTTAKVNAVFGPGSLAAKATPVLADLSVIGDSAGANAPKTSTFTAVQTLLVTLAKIQSLLTGLSTGILGVTTGTGALATLAKLILPTGANTSTGTTSAMGGTPGTIVVATTAVTTSSIILVTRNTPGGTLGQISVPVASIIANTSFVINSNANETSTFNYLIIN